MMQSEDKKDASKKSGPTRKFRLVLAISGLAAALILISLEFDDVLNNGLAGVQWFWVLVALCLIVLSLLNLADLRDAD